MPQGSDTTQTNLSFLGLQTKYSPKPVSTTHTHLLKHTVLHTKMKPMKDMFPTEQEKSSLQIKGNLPTDY